MPKGLPAITSPWVAPVVMVPAQPQRHVRQVAPIHRAHRVTAARATMHGPVGQDVSEPTQPPVVGLAHVENLDMCEDGRTRQRCTHLILPVLAGRERTAGRSIGWCRRARILSERQIGLINNS